MAETTPSTLVCSRCEAALYPEAGGGSGTVICPSCGVELVAAVFPALFRPAEKGRVGERVQLDDEASCFYHPGKKAVTGCENCGRFLCGLCEIKLADRLLCSACIESGKQQETIEPLRARRALYDNIAISLAVYPMVVPPFIYFTFLTAPVALFLAIRHWKTPQSIVPASKVKAAIAVLLAGLQLAGWALLIVFLVRL
ncbi:MAG: hypothetical protein QME60_09390 [Verrucomicrobiota bacterium]|nr:hypothetical protein [Verrucomicrobiota bacterium]